MAISQAQKDFFAQKFGDASQCMCLTGLTYSYLDTAVPPVQYNNIAGGTLDIWTGFALGLFQWVDMISPARARVTVADVEAIGTPSFGDYNAFRTLCSTPPYCYSPPVGQGACCVGYDCSITTQAGCTGTYLGDGTSCAGNPCGAEPTGACCVGENCTQTTQANCTGTWTQGLSCSPNPCITYECTTGQTKCEPGFGLIPYEYFTCIGGYWVSQGTNNANCGYNCTEGDQKCIGGFINNCVSNAWVPTAEECKGLDPLLILAAIAAGTVGVVMLVGNKKTTKRKK